MSLFIPHPSKLWKNLGAVAALGVSATGRRRLFRGMFQANLKRLHLGWSQLANRLLGTDTITVDLQLAGTTPFSYRPGTTDLLVLEQVFLDREYHFEPSSAGAIRYIVDLGSNIGVTALMWAERFPAARMVLVEPDPENFALLKRNTARFADRCTLINAAVAATRGTMSFFRSKREYSHSLVKTDDATSEIKVQTVTLPDILRENDFPRVDLLKMDIEGAETVVMPTLGLIPGLVHYLVAELHLPYTPRMFAEHCASAGLAAAESLIGESPCTLAFAKSRDDLAFAV